MKLSVVMPVYNERATVREICERLRALDLDKEIIIVDDGSTDGTREVLQRISGNGMLIVTHDRNRGKRAALRNGFRGREENRLE